MNFTIVGYGRAGSRTARVLRREDRDVMVVGSNDKKIDRTRDEGFEAVLDDDGTETMLWGTDIEDADAINRLTGDPNINSAACMLGKEYSCRTVIRISEDYHQEIYERYVDNVDEVIYPERLNMARAKTALLGGDSNATGDLVDQFRLTTVNVPDGASVIGEHVANIDLGAGGRAYAHGQERELMTIPLPGTVAGPDDQLALLVERNVLDRVRSRLFN